MKKITAKEYAIFSFIKQFLEDYGQSPTRRQISEAFSITVQGADYFVRQLAKKKVVSLRVKSTRNIRILKRYLGRQKHLW